MPKLARNDIANQKVNGVAFTISRKSIAQGLISIRIATADGDAEFFEADLCEFCDAVFDGVYGRVAKADAHAAGVGGAVHCPLAPWIDFDTVFYSGVKQAIRVDGFGQCNPEVDACDGGLKFSGCTEVFIERVGESLCLFAQHWADFGGVRVKVFRQVFREGHLFDRARACVCFQRQDVTHQWPRCNEVADAQGWCDGFGIRTAIDDSIFGVERVDRGWACAVKDQVGVAVIFEYRDVVFGGGVPRARRCQWGFARWEW